MEVIKAEAVAVWYGCSDSTQALISAGHLKIRLERAHLEAARKDEGTVFDSDAILEAALRTDGDRKTDLAAADAAAVAIRLHRTAWKCMEEMEKCDEIRGF